MTSRASFARGGLRAALLAAVVVVLSGGCQIFGCEPRRCQLNDVVGACAEGQVCGSDGFCRDVVVELPCGAPPASAARDLSLRILTTLGVEAMGNELFGVPSTVVVDVRGCTVEEGRPRCPVTTTTPFAAVVQPLGALSAPGAEAFAPLFDDASLSFTPGEAIAVEDTFAVEALFRTPTNGGDATVVRQFGAGGGWGIFMRNGVPLFLAGDRAVILGNANNATWHHVLCVVDAAAIVSAAAAGTPTEQRSETDVLCIADGSAVSGAFSAPDLAGQLFTDGGAPLVLGEVDAPGDPAVVVVRVWNGDVLAAAGLAGDSLAADRAGRPGEDDVIATARVETLAEEARARLARYVGLRVELNDDEAVFAVSNIDIGIPRAQPIAHGGFQRHEYVGGGWPRVAHTTQGLAGLLLEPVRIDLLDGAWAACPADRLTFLAGRNDACNQEDNTLNRDISIPAQGVSEKTGLPLGATLVFTVFGDLGGGGAPAFIVNGDVVCSSTSKDPGCTIDVIDDGDASHVRMTHRFTAPGPSTLDLQLLANGVIWSPQLELGNDPTAPMNGLGAVFLDQIVVRSPLAAGKSTSLRATVASDGSSIIMSPVRVADGGARFGRIASLITFATDDAEGGEQLFFGALTNFDGVPGGVRPEDEEPFPFLGGAPVKGGVDLGEPVDECSSCTTAAVPVPLAGEQSWNTTIFQGLVEPGFLIDADVLTRGVVPHPLPLAIEVKALASGCLEHRVPDVTLVACDDVASGVCSESERLVWKGEATVTNGPSLGESAAEGSFETALPALVADDATALLFELRFERPDGDGDGATHALFVLDDNDDPEDGTVLTVATQGADALVTVGDLEARLEGAWPEAGHWNQLTCLAGNGLRCAVNASAPVLVDGAARTLRAPVVARVDTASEGAGPIAFARAWFLPGFAAADSEIAAARLMDARIAASFGLGSTTRAGPFTLVEARASPTTLEKGGDRFDVGAHWPRVVADASGAPVYVADEGSGEGLVITGADLATGLGVNVDMLFDSVGDGRFFVLSHDPPEPPDEVQVAAVDSLAIERDEAAVHLTLDSPSDQAEPREPVTTRPIFFDGRSISVSTRLFNAVVSSGGRVTFAVDAASIDGGDAITIGGGVPLRLRALRVVGK